MKNNGTTLVCDLQIDDAFDYEGGRYMVAHLEYTEDRQYLIVSDAFCGVLILDPSETVEVWA